MDFDSTYRAACETLLAAVDVHTDLVRAGAGIAQLHRNLAQTGERALAGAIDEDGLQLYRKEIVAMLARLDERDRLRRADPLGEAVRQFLAAGQSAGYDTAAPSIAKTVEQPPVETDPSFADLERELAELQSQLSSLSTSGPGAGLQTPGTVPSHTR